MSLSYRQNNLTFEFPDIQQAMKKILIEIDGVSYFIARVCKESTKRPFEFDQMLQLRIQLPPQE